MNILWDVDGTLIANDHLGINLYRDAIREVYLIDGSIMELKHDGKTDRQIILEYIASTGSDFSREQEVEANLEGRSSSIYLNPISVRTPLAGAMTALAITSKLGHTNLLMTGNSRNRAHVKLLGAGFDLSLFDWDKSAFGSDFAKRNDLAEDLANNINGGVVVGDTPGDGSAARAGNFSFIGVTTGVYSAEDLLEYKPVLVLNNLELEIVAFINMLEELDSQRSS